MARVFVLRRPKEQVLRLADRLGVNRTLGPTRWRRERLVVLCYHGISLADEHSWNPELYITRELFRQRLGILRDEGCSVLPLHQALRSLKAGSLPPKSVSITFDDGFQDFSAAAYPVLREFGYHATLYLTTYYCRFQRPVFDPLCSYLLWKGRGRALDCTGLLPGGGRFSLETTDERADLAWRIRKHALDHGLSAEAKDRLAHTIAGRLEVDYSEIVQRRLLFLLSPEEVRALSPETVDVQLHTHRHRSPAGHDLFVQEIQDNRRAIEDMTQRREDLVHFCYPSGEWLPQHPAWLREAGVESAVTCEFGLATRAADPLLLPRVFDTSLMSASEFRGWLSGAAAALTRLRTARLPLAGRRH